MYRPKVNKKSEKMTKFETLKQIFTNSVKQFGKRTALSMFERESMTYNELGDRADYVGKLLLGAGLNAGDKVVLLSSNMPNWGVCYFAAVNLGMVIVPIMTEFSGSELDKIIEHSDAKALCVSDKLYNKLSEEQSQALLYGAYLHDIGKIKVDPEILISEKKLTDAQWEQMKRHPLDGADIVRTIEGFDNIALIVEQHHEKYNGFGYPKGLKGDEIQYLARILALADSFDAMTAKRPYQKTKTIDEAFDEIIRCAGTQFDPDLAHLFVEAVQNSYL